MRLSDFESEKLCLKKSQSFLSFYLTILGSLIKKNTREVFTSPGHRVLPCHPGFLHRLRLVDRQPASPLLCSPHGGEEQDVEDDQGDAGQELDKEAAEPPEGDEVGPSDPGDPVGEVDQANLPLPIIQHGCRVSAVKQPDLWFCCLVNTESTFTTFLRRFFLTVAACR